MARNELHLIKELLPIWSKYADGFVFMLDTCTDGTEEYLKSVQSQYNILEILTNNRTNIDEFYFETDLRGKLFECAKKYSKNIICLDADEYLDGTLTKIELEDLLNSNKDTLIYLQWRQYTSCNTIRIDGPWYINYKDRIGNYSSEFNFDKSYSHSTHLPIPTKQIKINPSELFIAHLQWLDKTHVAIKQYYWKVYDYVTNLLHNINVVDSSAYDESVNWFQWQEEYTYDTLKINPFIIEENAIYKNYRLSYIKSRTNKYNIPNLGDWGMDIINLDETTKPNINRYKLSVITAIGKNDTYSRFFERYLNSVLDQHMFLQTEHIIVYSEWHPFFENFKKYPNFKLIKEDKSLGVYNAWNIGIKNSTTEYVTNWNVDDIRHPINTKIKYDAITKNNVDLVYNWYIGTQNESENFSNIDYQTKQYLQYPDNYHEIVLENCYAGPDPLWKKSLHDTVGYFDYTNFNTIGDWEMWIRFAQSGAIFKLIPYPLCLYLDHQNTVSKTQQTKVYDEKVRLFQKYYQKNKNLI
jgi:hypothetical protein